MRVMPMATLGVAVGGNQQSKHGLLNTIHPGTRGRLIMLESSSSSQLTPLRLRITRLVPVTHDLMLDLRGHAKTRRSNLI
jgi:hypothetical protein